MSTIWSDFWLLLPSCQHICMPLSSLTKVSSKFFILPLFCGQKLWTSLNRTVKRRTGFNKNSPKIAYKVTRKPFIKWIWKCLNFSTKKLSFLWSSMCKIRQFIFCQIIFQNIVTNCHSTIDWLSKKKRAEQNEIFTESKMNPCPFFSMYLFFPILSNLILIICCPSYNMYQCI